MKDHKPVIIEEFGGLWARGDEDSCPLDHFSDCNNVAYFESGFETRPGIDVLDRGGPLALGNVIRMYNYITENGESLLALIEGGDIYHCLLDGSGTIYGPVLSIADMEDFGFQMMGKYAYITPFKTYTKPTGENYQWGLEDEFVYVYKGDGTNARKAAGTPPTNGGDTCLVAYVSDQVGVVTQGIHIIGQADANATDLTSLGPEALAVVYAPGDTPIAVNNLFIGEVGVTERRLYMTHAIDPADWNPTGDIRSNYTYYLAKTISNNTELSTVINVADADLTVPWGPPSGPLNTPTTSAMYAVNSEDPGHCDLGLHVVGVVYETDTGYLTSPGPEFFAVQTYVDDQKAIDVFNIPISPDSFVTKRHLVSTRALSGFNGNNRSDEFEYQFYFIPGGEIDDNTSTEKQVSYYDAELLEDASHLIDNFAEIPAGVCLSQYNGRMVLLGINGHENESLAYISAKGEPEAFDQIEGFVKFPVDGKPLTNAQEFRDTCFLFKQTKTAAVTDNGSSPAFWEVLMIDYGIGAPVHGIAMVLDSDGVNIDYILVADWSGLMVFSGRYLYPPLTWKIEDRWEEIDRNDFANIQIVNDSILHRIYITLPDRQMLYADWDHGLDAKSIAWCPWTFDIETTTIALIESNRLLIGSNANV